MDTIGTEPGVTVPPQDVAAPSIIPDTSRWRGDHVAGLLAARVAPKAVRALLCAFGDLDEARAASFEELETTCGLGALPDLGWEPPEGHQVLVWGSAGYPGHLAAWSGAPPALIVAGDPGALTQAGVAIVGTRAMTRLGEAAAQVAATAAVGVGASVISGLAVGVDSAAHRATLDAQGTTVAVLGSSLDVLALENPERAALGRDIVAGGGAVISALPGPGVRARAATLHARNATIVGLASVVVPCEGSLRSGTASAVRAALALDRRLVVPLPRRPVPGGELAAALCDPDGLAPERIGAQGLGARRCARRTPVADGVAHDRDELVTLIQLGVALGR